jgi:hypothetical protein
MNMTILRAIRTWACFMFLIGSVFSWTEWNPPINVLTVLVFVNLLLLGVVSTVLSLADTMLKAGND